MINQCLGLQLTDLLIILVSTDREFTIILGPRFIDHNEEPRRRTFYVTETRQYEVRRVFTVLPVDLKLDCV